jgi:molybdopterin synthase sulfur carrier subunit
MDALRVITAMVVDVKFAAEYVLYQNKHSGGKVDVPEGSTVNDLIARLKLPYKYTRAITVNGKRAGLNTVLTDGDSLRIFPPVIGGG